MTAASEPTVRGGIILLNGVSSSGKSTLARELVRRLPDHFHLSADDFDLVIERMEDREKQRLIPVPTEYFFHRTVAMFSAKGVSLVVDTVLHDSFNKHDCLAVLSDYPVFAVGVHCPAEELDRRERQRGDRPAGQGRQQLAYTHREMSYDVEVDTLADSVERCAAKIVEAYHRGSWPDAWLRTVKAVALDS